MEECPKCGSQSAWYKKTTYDLILTCLCGLNKVVFSILDKVEIQHNDSGDSVKLPREGSHLRRTLYAVDCLEEGTTAEIAERLRDMRATYSTSDVASYLTILRSKGLVMNTVVRRGVVGGSTWTVTDAASDMLTYRGRQRS